MSTRKTSAHDIAARCKKLPGWSVTKPRGLDGGYKIKAPDGWTTLVHLSSSDVNAERVILRQLNEHGLEQSEAAWERQREREKQLELDRQRTAAAKRAQELTQRAALTAKAAGPYAAPEEVPKDWFAQTHPAPWHRWVIMTPELASYLIDNHNTDNRPEKKKTVEHYRNVILSGQWHLTHQGMAMDTRGILQDGQHRLMAIRDAGVACPVSFYVGMAPENFLAIDEGLLRRAADLFGKAGEKNTAHLQATVKLLGAYQDPLNSRAAYHTRQTNETVYNQFHEDADAIREAVSWGVNNYAKAKMNATGCAAAYYLIRKQNGKENPFIDAFFAGLMTGLKGATRTRLDEDDPREKLREWVFNLRDSKNKRLNAFDNMCLILIAWNCVVRNERPRFLRWGDSMDVPGIEMCSPNGRWASAIPSALVGEVYIAPPEERTGDQALVAAAS